MSARLLLLALLALSACGCSKSRTNPMVPPPDGRGAPLGTAGVFEAGSALLWSAATDEIVGTGGFGSASPGALLALRALTGTTRVLDPELALNPVASPAGSPIYYLAILAGSGDADSIVFRRVALPGGAPKRIDACPALCLYLCAISSDDAWLAWSTVGFNGADSIVIERAADGARTRIGPGTPTLWSPDGAQILFRESFADPGFMLHDRGMGTSEPFALGLPAGATPAGLRWDAAGVHALYLMNSREVWVRHVGTGASAQLYTTQDTLLVTSAAWSPDGGHAAFWSDAAGGGADERTRSLHLVDVAARSGAVVAVGTVFAPPSFAPPIGAIAFSPDARTVAYQYEGQLFTSHVPGVGAVRASGLGAGPATTAGSDALASLSTALTRQRAIESAMRVPSTPVFRAR